VGPVLLTSIYFVKALLKTTERLRYIYLRAISIKEAEIITGGEIKQSMALNTPILGLPIGREIAF
jgi:hypothetical protein